MKYKKYSKRINKISKTDNYLRESVSYYYSDNFMLNVVNMTYLTKT